MTLEGEGREDVAIGRDDHVYRVDPEPPHVRK
ncbi:Uncharacterised protein [Mycobacteroides abscessus]|nr:Uncharacterised protein [Mycobacteroides abscessus]